MVNRWLTKFYWTWTSEVSSAAKLQIEIDGKQFNLEVSTWNFSRHYQE